MASVKNANPSSENGIPIIGPAQRMNSGQSSPNSNDSTVPETAPTANRIAVPLAQWRVSAIRAASPVRNQRISAITIIRGIAIPATAKTIWNASEIAICERAASKSVIGGLCHAVCRVKLSPKMQYQTDMDGPSYPAARTVARRLEARIAKTLALQNFDDA